MRNLALCAALASGCAQTDSSDLLTSGIYAGLSASTTGDGVTHVRATLYVGNPINLNFVNVTGDDRLVAIHNSQQQTMTETQLLNVVSYHTQFQGDDEGLEFQIAFLREVDRGAPNSRATLPAKFTMDALPASASRAAPLTLSWSPAPSADLMRWEAKGDCIENATDGIMGDPGTIVIPGETIKKRMGETIADQCEITVMLTRSRLGQLDPGYGKGGIISGQQIRSAKTMSVP
jgi:hypothetical protein